MSIELKITERSAWTGDLYRLQIESGKAKFWGSDIYEGRFPDTMPLKEQSVEELDGAITLLGVLNWRKVYRPEDVGSVVDDGSSWELTLVTDQGKVSSKGYNASPSYKSSDITSLNEERFGLLREAIFTALNHSTPFDFALDNQ